MWIVLAVAALIYAKHNGVNNLIEAIAFAIVIFIATKEAVEFLLCILRYLP